VKVEAKIRVAGKQKRTFWLYRPEPLPDRLGLVLVAPAGTNLLHGKALSPDDRPEHMPYARAGFAVIAYSIDGDPGDGSDAKATTDAVVAYKDSKAGLANARAALDIAFDALPIDEDLVFAAGHGSAGTHALLLAREEPRVRAAVAYAPATGLDGREGLVMKIDEAIPGFASFIRWSLPRGRAADVRVPLFIYQSKVDEVVRADDTRAYVDALRAAGKTVTYVEAPTGTHYEGMQEDGIPKALAWLLKR
jgi:dienelactone hydrolase